ncbi:hypothetical protein JA1_004087 [Spathaspora sp. JA1]|nr:hypothetical protein JA1_004087 [Spathaspora sp. JA1]
MKFIFTALAAATLASALHVNKRADDCVTACVQGVEANSPTCTKYGPDEDNISKCICQQEAAYWEPLWECANKCPAYASFDLTWDLAKPVYCAKYPGEPTEPEEPEDPEPEEPKTTEPTPEEPETTEPTPEEPETTEPAPEEPETTAEPEEPSETAEPEEPSETAEPEPEPTVTQHNAAAALGVGSVAYLLALAMI